MYTESSSTTNLFIAWSDLTFCSLTPIDDQYYSISPGICAEDPCLRYSCADCTSLPNCGFCGTLGKCLKGSPSSSDSFACPDWNWATPSKCCQFQTSCTECLTPSLGGACSYCSASNQCLPRSSSSCASNIDSCFGVNNCPNGFTGDCQNRAYQSRNVFQSQLSSTPAITFSPTGDGGVYFFEIHLRVQQYSDVSIAEFNGDGDGFVLKMRSSGFTEFVLFCNERIISTITSRTRLPLNDLTRIAVVLYGLDPPQCNVTTSSARMYIGIYHRY